MGKRWIGKSEKGKPNDNKHGKCYLTSLVHINTNTPITDIYSHLSIKIEINKNIISSKTSKGGKDGKKCSLIMVKCNNVDWNKNL